MEEVRRHSHCLAFSSAASQSQTYYVSYDSYTEHLRWHRTASKVPGVARSGPERAPPQPLTCASLSDCVPEGELRRPVLLQLGGVAASALLQPGPHTPQPKEQLHVPAQRCPRTHQVRLSDPRSGVLRSAVGSEHGMSAWVLLTRSASSDLRMRLRSNYR